MTGCQVLGCYWVAHQTLRWKRRQILRGRSFIPPSLWFVCFFLLRGKEGQINLENEEHHTCPQSQYSGVWGRRIKGLRPASATNSSEPSRPGIYSETLLAQEPHKPRHHWDAPSKPLSSELHWAAKWGSEQCGLKPQRGKRYSFLCLLGASCRFFPKH